VLGGADAIVFTGGIGENCAPLRDIVEKQFAFLNATTLVIHAEEEWEMIRECFLLLS
jgi:butyrate kinase